MSELAYNILGLGVINSALFRRLDPGSEGVGYNPMAMLRVP
jgi:hypothetical protein